MRGNKKRTLQDALHPLRLNSSLFTCAIILKRSVLSY